MYFDENTSIDSLQFYDHTSIPAIKVCDVPADVSSVHFKSDLSNVSPIEVVNQESLLFKSL